MHTYLGILSWYYACICHGLDFSASYERDESFLPPAEGGKTVKTLKVYMIRPFVAYYISLILLIDCI